MTSLADWYQDESNAIELAVLLKNPTLRKALDVVASANTPGFNYGAPIADQAMLHAFQAGVHHVQRSLNTLTQPPMAPEAPVAEWQGAHVFPEPSQQ